MEWAHRRPHGSTGWDRSRLGVVVAVGAAEPPAEVVAALATAASPPPRCKCSIPGHIPSLGHIRLLCLLQAIPPSRRRAARARPQWWLPNDGSGRSSQDSLYVFPDPAQGGFYDLPTLSIGSLTLIQIPFFGILGDPRRIGRRPAEMLTPSKASAPPPRQPKAVFRSLYKLSPAPLTGPPNRLGQQRSSPASVRLDDLSRVCR